MTLHVLLPNDIDDPARPSGGNVYDRRLCRGLLARGWVVHEHAVPGEWPSPAPPARAALAAALAGLPDDALTVVDGLIASVTPELLAEHAQRLRLVVLVHLPLGATGDADALRREADALATAAAVVTTSAHCRQRLLELYDLAPARVHVARPGTDPARIAKATPEGTRLLCVAAVTHHKGHDLLLRALAELRELPWSCVLVGALDREPAFAEGLGHRAHEYRIGQRLSFTGALPRAGVAAQYARADLLVLPSRGETYGMVVTEALARAIPVLATDGQGLPEALGLAPDGTRPGLLVPPGDAPALAHALGRWLREPELRTRLRESAHARRGTLPRWATTVDTVAAVLSSLPSRTAAPRRVARAIGAHSGR
ncbi:MAG TPA: glycosyltransferase family 4 protein [Micromonosporaceae bacterium]